MGDRRGAYGGLVGRPEGKTPPGKPRSRRENNTGLFEMIVVVLIICHT